MSDGMLSLVCATHGRYRELERLIVSLDRQTCKNFELIVVDQNANDLIVPLLATPISFPMSRISSSVSSNTHARNLGLRAASGTWVAFPDDDCWYHGNFVADLLRNIEAHPDADGFFTNWSDPNNNRDMFQFEEGKMTMADAFRLVSCICLFLRRDKVLETGGFNERLGFGDKTVVKAGEEQDLTLRMISRSMQLIKLPQLKVHHEIGNRPWNDAFLERIRSQGACDYFFTRKYIGSIAAWKLATKWTFGYMYNVMRGNRKNARWYSKKLEGISLSSAIE
jgi:glycosyltransferase involved in cell wall biosynthesis